jgi:SPP1 family predicted phage head-tail adaptor
MQAGNLKHLVTISNKVQTGTGDRGQPIYTWQTLGTVPAEIVELSGRKLELARQLVSTATHQVTIRYLAGLETNSQVVFGSRTFNIGYVQNVKLMNFTMILTCTEQLTGG